MERFSLITVILFFLSGCATEIIPTDLYHDEPKFDYTKNKYLLHDKKYSYVIDNIKKHLNYFTRKYMTVSDKVNF